MRELPKGIAKYLGPAELVILLADHGGAEKRPCFYRDQIWLLWRESGASCAEITGRWNALPWYVRMAICERRLQAKDATAKYVGSRLTLAQRARPAAWALHPDANPQTWKRPVKAEQQIRALLAKGDLQADIAEQVNVSRQLVSRIRKEKERRLRRVGAWYRNRLFLSWHDAEGAATCRNLRAIGLRWSRLPEDVQDALLGDATRFTSAPNADFRNPTPKVVMAAIGQAKRRRDGDGRVTDESPPGGGSRQKRGALFLAWEEEDGLKPSAMIDRWNGWSDGRRKAEGGNCWRKLATKLGQRSNSLALVRRDISQAKWEREISGKYPSYGRDLWLLRKSVQEGWSNAQIYQAWQRLSAKSRGIVSPEYPGKLPGGAEGVGRVANGIRRARAAGGEAFVASIRPYCAVEPPKAIGIPDALLLAMYRQLVPPGDLARGAKRRVAAKIIEHCLKMPEEDRAKHGNLAWFERRLRNDGNGQDYILGRVVIAARRDGKGKPRPGKAPPIETAAPGGTSRKGKGGRPQKWDALRATVEAEFRQAAKTGEPLPSMLDTLNNYRRQNGRAIGKGILPRGTSDDVNRQRKAVRKLL